MKIAIIHPWFPQYRRAFFEKLVIEARSEKISVDIYYGETPPEWGDRGDTVNAPYAKKLPTRFIKFFGRTLTYKSLREVRLNGPYDLLIVEQAVRNLETYELFLRRVAPRIAFWGHGRTYTKSISPIQERLKALISLRANWFFAYTQGGLNHMKSVGFDPSAITVVQNSIDSTQLSKSIDSFESVEVAKFQNRWDLKGQTAIFIGGLDESKRLDFLITACKRVAEDLPNFRLLIIGDGKLRDFISQAQNESPWLKYLGPLFDEDKALAMKSSDLMVMPGRVGLVAVDSFAARLPIVTTDWKFHAPEFEYLTNGFNSLISEDDSIEYARGLIELLSDTKSLARLQDGCSVSAKEYSTQRMVDNFLQGIKKALAV